MMRILSFDTSSPRVHLALCEDGEIIHQQILVDNHASQSAKVLPADKYNANESKTPRQNGAPSAKSLTVPNPRQESVALLMPGIDKICKLAAWQKEEIDFIVAGIGPGGFTGIRTGVVTARTLAQALHLPLAGVSLLECYAHLNSQPSAIVLCPTKGFYYVGTITSGVFNAFYLSESEMSEHLTDYKFWYVDAATKAAILGSGASIKDLPEIDNIAALQATIIWQKISFKSKIKQDLLTAYPFTAVLPLYLREPSTTIKKAHV